MVFKTLVNFAYNRGPDQIWKTRRILKLSSHMYGRRRNCFKIALYAVRRSLKHCTRGRQDKRRDLVDLHNLRIDSGAREHGIDRFVFKEGLERCLVLLSKRILSDLANWEPRTFKVLTDVAKAKAWEDKEKLEYPGMKREDTSHFVHRGMLQKK